MGLKVFSQLTNATKKLPYIAPEIRTLDSKSIESLGLKMEQLTGDVVQIPKKAKSPETYMDMIQHFIQRHPENIALTKNLAIKGVEAHPTDNSLILMKNFLTGDDAALINDLSRSISLNPTAQSYLIRYEHLMETGKQKEAMEDLKKALDYAKKENLEPEFISEIESMLKVRSLNIARELKPLPLTAEQKAFNSIVNEYWNKYQKEINEVFEEKSYFSLSNANTTIIETSAKNHLLNSIKQIGKAEDFGLTKGMKLYHGTDTSAYHSINAYGFDLSKCGRVETGKGAYFGFDEQTVRNAYGSAVVVARFTGKTIAKVEPGVYDVVSGGEAITPFKLTLAEKLGLDLNLDNLKIVDEIISKYYNRLLESKGIEGIITDVSYNAGMPYFVVPNPAKFIEIL